MNSRRLSFLCILECLVFAATAAASSDLASPERRRASVEAAAALVQPSAPAPLPADLKNPFIWSHGKNAAHVARQFAGDREVLSAIANYIVPTGVLQVGDTPMLLLREKKLKVGDYLTITFEGHDYVVELAAVSTTSFTLRLNKEEITQPINP
jgi:hypothetical protein